MTREKILRSRIRFLVGILIVGLVVSGATAIPLQWELDFAARVLGAGASPESGLVHWIVKVRDGLNDAYAKYPFLAYGTDWLAFGHFVIAVAFVGLWRDPMRNSWLISFGLIACVLIVPYAFVFGQMRGIPFYWRLIDCSFGIFGLVPLWLCRRYVNELAVLEKQRAKEN